MPLKSKEGKHCWAQKEKEKKKKKQPSDTFKNKNKLGYKNIMWM